MRYKLILCLSVFLLFGCTKKTEGVIVEDEIVVTKESKNVDSKKLNDETKDTISEKVIDEDEKIIIKEKTQDITNKEFENKEEVTISIPNKENTIAQQLPTINSHTHQFSEMTENIYHEEVGHYESVLISPGWIEENPIYQTTSWMECNQCGHKMNSGTDIDAHYKASFDCSGWTDYSERVLIGSETIEHEPVYESVYVVDKEAYSETVITGYQCACGERK